MNDEQMVGELTRSQAIADGWRRWSYHEFKVLTEGLRTGRYYCVCGWWYMVNTNTDEAEADFIDRHLPWVCDEGPYE